MEPVQRGMYTREHLEELLEEERAKSEHYRAALRNIREADFKLIGYAPDECSRAYRIASDALNLPVFPKTP